MSTIYIITQRGSRSRINYFYIVNSECTGECSLYFDCHSVLFLWDFKNLRLHLILLAESLFSSIKKYHWHESIICPFLIIMCYSIYFVWFCDKINDKCELVDEPKTWYSNGNGVTLEITLDKKASISCEPDHALLFW